MCVYIYLELFVSLISWFTVCSMGEMSMLQIIQGKRLCTGVLLGVQSKLLRFYFKRVLEFMPLICMAIRSGCFPFLILHCREMKIYKMELYGFNNIYIFSNMEFSCITSDMFVMII